MVSFHGAPVICTRAPCALCLHLDLCGMSRGQRMSAILAERSHGSVRQIVVEEPTVSTE